MDTTTFTNMCRRIRGFILTHGVPWAKAHGYMPKPLRGKKTAKRLRRVAMGVNPWKFTRYNKAADAATGNDKTLKINMFHKVDTIV